MAITDPLVLPEDVVLVPVAELPEDVRGRLGCEEGDFAITRPRLRVPSRILDPDSARLLGEFRSPTTVAEAVIRYSRERGSDPETILTEAYPLLDRLFGAGFLVAEGSAESEAIEPTLAPGEELAGFRELECIQVLDDTELHQVRREEDGRVAALKLERTPGVTKGALEREAAVLAHLDGSVSPRLLAAGETETRAAGAISPRSGSPASRPRWPRPSCGRASPGRACAPSPSRVARAYAGLHERGVIHGDVHPRNVLITAAGEAVLLDFGYAAFAGAGSEATPRSPDGPESVSSSSPSTRRRSWRGSARPGSCRPASSTPWRPCSTCWSRGPTTGISPWGGTRCCGRSPGSRRCLSWRAAWSRGPRWKRSWRGHSPRIRTNGSPPWRRWRTRSPPSRPRGLPGARPPPRGPRPCSTG